MLKIRLKGKHIVYSCIALITIIAIVYTAIPTILYNYAKSQENTSKKNYYYQLIYNYFPYSKEAPKTLYFSAQLGNDNDLEKMIIIFPNFTSTSSSFIPSNSQQNVAIDKYKQVIEKYPQSIWSKHALRELGKIYYNADNYHKAEENLKRALKESDLYEGEIKALLAKIHLERFEYKKALQLAEEHIQKKPTHSPLQFLDIKGRALIGLKKWEEAEKIYQDLPQRAHEFYKKIINEEDEDPKTININTEQWNKLAITRLNQINSQIKNNSPKANITGRVNINNKGLSDVYLFLLDDDFNSIPADLKKLNYTKTDEKGNYSFENLPPNEYAIGIGVYVSQIQGNILKQQPQIFELREGVTKNISLDFVPLIKVYSPPNNHNANTSIKFSWEPVQEADHYSLSIGPVTKNQDGKITGFYTSVFNDRIDDNSFNLNIDEEIKNFKASGIAYDEDGINPYSILGPLYYGGEYTYRIDAFDDKGMRITSSSGHYSFGDNVPVVKTPDDKLTAGDKLLIKKEYQHAIKTYKQSIKENPQDLHSLKILARLYQYGWTKNTKDYSQAAKYYQQILSIKDTYQIRNSLANALYMSGEYSEAKKTYLSLIDTPDQNWLLYYHLAKIETQLKNIESAMDYYRNAITMDNGKYVQNYPVALSILLGKNDDAMFFASKIEDGHSYINILRKFTKENHQIPLELQQCVKNGDFKQAEDLCPATQEGLFYKALIKYVISPVFPREELEKIIANMKPDIYRELIQCMLLT